MHWQEIWQNLAKTLENIKFDLKNKQTKKLAKNAPLLWVEDLMNT